MKSLQGQLLVATPQLLDPNFFRTVVLIVQHDQGSALGLVLNRALDTSVRDAWQEVSAEACEVDGPLHQGGPCDGPLMVVHTDPACSAMEVAEGIHFTADREDVEQLAARNDSPMKFFVGYAGWGPGQLEAEIEEGSWVVIPATPEQVFSEEEDLWARAYAQVVPSVAFPWLDPDRIPDDPSVN